jgi:hypothetical protein
MREPHPAHGQPIPAFEQIKLSITTHHPSSGEDDPVAKQGVDSSGDRSIAALPLVSRHAERSGWSHR